MKKFLLSALLLGSFVVPSAFSQSSPTLGFVNRWNSLTNAFGATTSNSTATVFNYGSTNYDQTASGALIIPVYRGRGMAFMGSLVNGAGTNSVVTYTLDLSYDGTNWTTSGPITFTATCSGSTTQVFYTNILADRFDNLRFARLTSFAGNASGDIVTNNWLVWSGIP